MSVDIYRQKVNDLNRRAEKRGAVGALSQWDLYAVYEFYGGHCLAPGCKKTDVQFDHVIPLEKKGENHRRNLQLLCESHNKAKKAVDYRPKKRPFCPDDYVSAAEAEELSAAAAAEGKGKYDWDRIRIEYIVGTISMRDLAKKHGIPTNTLTHHALNEDWNRERAEYRYKFGTELVQQIRERDLSARVQATETAQQVIASWLSGFSVPATANDALNAAKLLLLLDGQPIDRQERIVKDWRDAAGNDATDLDAFATAAADRYYGSGDYGKDSGASAR